MVQLNVLTGKQAGASWVARRFPVRIGRDARADFRSEESGVWDDHGRLEFEPKNGFVFVTQPGALSSVNGQPVERVLLRHGDILDLGGLRLQFWLAETRQRSLRLREVLSWIGIVLVSLGQIVMIYWLIH